jgi:excisionase family DNA binding protein
MSQITASEVSTILKISKRTLFRWEKEGKIRSVRDGILKVRVYDKDYIKMVKNILELNKKEKEHLAKLPEILDQVKKHCLEQDYIPGKPLKLSTRADVEAAMKAFDDEEKWMDKHKQILNELFSFPRDIIKELLF